MATLSSTGIGSGLNVQRIVQQSGQNQRNSLTPLQVAENKTQTQISALSHLRQRFSELEITMRNLAAPITPRATSSNVLIQATPGAQAIIPRGFDVEVVGIAKAQAMASGAMFPMGAGWGAGTLRLQMGQWSIVPPGFTPSSGVPVDIAISATDTTQVIANKINAAQGGVQASVLRDIQGERLVLKSSELGAAQGFSVSIIDDDGSLNDNSGLSRLFSEGLDSIKQFAQNGQARVDGVLVSTNTNEFIVDGTTINFGAASVGDRSQVNVTSNNSDIRSKLDAVVGAFNNLQQFLQTSTRFDAATKTAGPLQGDSLISGMDQRLRKMMSEVSNASNSVLSLNAAGSLSIFEQANISSNWSNLTSSLAISGTLGAFVQQANTKGGTLDLKNQTYNNILEHNRQHQVRIEERAQRLEATYLKKFQLLDSQLSRMQALNAYWTQQNQSFFIT